MTNPNLFSSLLKRLNFLRVLKVKDKIALSYTILIICLISLAIYNGFMTLKINQMTDKMFNVDLHFDNLATIASDAVYMIQIDSLELEHTKEFNKRLGYYRINDLKLSETLDQFGENFSGDEKKTAQVQKVRDMGNDFRESIKKFVDIQTRMVPLRDEYAVSKEKLLSLLDRSVDFAVDSHLKITPLFPVYQSLNKLNFCPENKSEAKPLSSSQLRRSVDAKLRGKAGQIVKQYNHTVDLYLQLMELYQQSELARTEADSHYGVMWRTLNKIAVDYRQKISGRINEIESSQKRFSNIAIMISVLSISLALVMAIIIFSDIVNPLNRISSYARKISENEFPIVDMNYFNQNDEFGGLAKDFNNMCLNMQGMVNEIKNYSAAINEAVKTSIDNLQQISAGAMSQSAYLEETTGMVMEMVESINDVNTFVQSSNDLSSAAYDSAQNGGIAVRETVSEVYEIHDISKIAEKSLTSLSDASRKINSITEIISTIADQTNMLALNAAIEAARAGEQGRGFAVVSDQVAKLAERSARSAQEIEDLIGSIQDGIENVMKVIEKSISKVDEGVKRAEVSGKALEMIITNVEGLDHNISHISNISNDVVLVSKKINDAIQNIAATSEESAAGAENSFNQSRTLGEIADSLHEIVSKFHLEED